MPATAKEERWVTVGRDLVWRFYKALKAYKQNPSPQAAPAFRRRFDRIFTLRTGYQALDKLLERLHRRKTELLKMLDYPDIPLHTNASESALRTFVTKQDFLRHSEPRGPCGTRYHARSDAECRKLGISFYHYLGDRLGMGDEPIPQLI